MPHGFLRNSSPVEIVPGVAFTTPQVRVAADAVEYFRGLIPDPADPEDHQGLAAAQAARAAIVAGVVVDHETQHVPPAPDGYGEDDLDRYRIQSFDEATVPEGQIQLTRALQVADGVISVAATFAPIPLLMAQTQMRAAAQIEYDTRRQSPMSWDFGQVHAFDDAGGDLGPAGAQQLQMADVNAQDWQAVTLRAGLLSQGGAGATVLPLRTLANVWVQAPASAVLQVFAAGDGTQVSAFARQLAMRQRFAALKGEITAAADSAACLAIDVTAGWPA